jgi:tetratricopeptide (TPR) repeat protein
MRSNTILSVLLATMLMPAAAVASPLIPSMAGAARTAQPTSAGACAEDGRLAAMASFNSGMIFYVQGDHDEAVAQYGAAIRHDPRMTAAYDGRGHALQAKGDMDGALASFDEGSRRRLAEKMDWLLGRTPGAPASGDSDGGAIALVAL